jgi:hypothetical protein
MRGDIQRLVEGRDWGVLLALADSDRKVLSRILPLTYQPDGLLRWQAVEALGLAAGRVADRDAEFVRGIIRRLIWSLNDESGGIGWSAPEAIGEILANRPKLFAEYAPIVISLFDNLEEDYFHSGIIWAISRIAQVAPELMLDAYEPVLAFLGDADPHVRGLAARCLGYLGIQQAAPRLEQLTSDGGQLLLYADGKLNPTTVGSLAREAIARLCL